MNLMVLRKNKKQLELSLKKLEAKNKELEQFVYIAAHDLREPLNTITSFTEIVIDDLNSLIIKSDADIYVGELPVIKLSKSDTKTYITISSKKNKLGWEFSIKDNGIGIDLKYQHKIFSLFQKLHHEDEYEGTGIGLAHCKKIVDPHNGDLWLESELGKGSVFYFTIKKI